jgi:protein-L-isoaspartate(D-aspartate) O-methyltransferase
MRRGQAWIVLVSALLGAEGCCRPERPATASSRSAAPAPATPAAAAREELVRSLAAQDIRDARVLDAMRAVPRERFVPEALRVHAYEDRALPIGEGQTISQPYIVAYMAQALALRGPERVLEVGSGSGYAAAILSRLAAEVYGIEIEEALYARSVETLGALGYPNVRLRRADGFHGWPEAAPFDAIVLSFAAEAIPPPLWTQLAAGGRIVYPEGPAGGVQELVLVTKTVEGRKVERLHPVRFVPMQREGE